MTFLQRSCLLAGTLGLLVLVAPLSGAQQGNPQGQSGHDSANTADRRGQQESQAYQRGYQQGMEDQRTAAEPSPGYADWKDAADRSTYRSGYQAGYCHDEKNRTGYYNGVYGYGPPVLRNGYYGYNAPDQYCENGSINARRLQGKPGSQNRVEYGGGG